MYTHKSDPDLDGNVAEYFAETENFDQRRPETDTHRDIGSSNRAQLSVVAVDQTTVQLLRRTCTPRSHVSDLSRTSHRMITEIHTV